MKGGIDMKKSNFVALVLGTWGGVFFALGMCMALLPEWNAFAEGVAFGLLGLLIALIACIIWCKMEGKKLSKINAKTLLRILYAIVAILVFGTGICMCLALHQIVWGTLIGLLGIVMLIALIPIIKGVK